MVSAIQDATLNLVNSTREIEKTRLPENLRRNVLSFVKNDILGILGAMMSVTSKPVIGTEETVTKNTVPVKKLKTRKRRK